MNDETEPGTYDGAYAAVVAAAAKIVANPDQSTLTSGLYDAAEQFLFAAFDSWKHAEHEKADDETHPDPEQYDGRDE